MIRFYYSIYDHNIVKDGRGVRHTFELVGDRNLSIKIVDRVGITKTMSIWNMISEGWGYRIKDSLSIPFSN
jgi:hypothetical protein